MLKSYEIHCVVIENEEQLQQVLKGVEEHQIIPFTKATDPDSLKNIVIFGVQRKDIDWLMFAHMYEVNEDFLKGTMLEQLMKGWRAIEYQPSWV